LFVFVIFVVFVVLVVGMEGGGRVVWGCYHRQTSAGHGSNLAYIGTKLRVRENEL
jgi:hypothetical protein